MAHPTASLPDAVHALVPELAEARFADEVLATCGDCAMLARAGAPRSPERKVFDSDARCCTYHPELPNYLAGKALSRGDIGSERVRLRLRDAFGLHPHGIEPQRPHLATLADPDAFGRAGSAICPFWVPGPYGCSIHRDRQSVCRTWHCKVVGGSGGRAAWEALKLVLILVEDRLSALCVREGAPPAKGASPEAWEAWYRWCGEHVDGLSAERAAALRDSSIEAGVAELTEAIAVRDAPLPDVVVPTVRDVLREPGGVAMSAYSRYDMVELPPWIFVFLSKLDGERTWRRARDAAEAELGHPIGDDLVLLLHRRGLIDAVDVAGVRPGMNVRITPGR